MRFLPLSLLFVGLVLPQAFAQADRFAAEPAVITHVEYVVAMQPDGTGYRERTAAVKIQSEAAVHEFGVLSFQFAGASEHVDIRYLRVRRPDGTVVETPATDAQEQPTAVTREAPFYSDLKEKQIPVRSLRVGDVLEWQVRTVRTKAEAPRQFWAAESFAGTIVTLDETVELRVAKDSPVQVWTNPEEKKPEESGTATEKVYTWHHHNFKPTVGPVAEVEKEDLKHHTLTPEEELDGREGKLPSYAWSTFPTWAAVGDWYRSLERDRHTPDADIKAKVAELTAGKTTLEDRVRAVYDYVGLQVRYVGVAFGIGRYQPHPAGEVLSNQYGDCKDKHTLLAAMLAELGLHPDAVLIGAGVRFNEALPSPGAFNHLITQVGVEGKPVWLDATAETAPYRLLLYQIRDKQALVIPDEGPAHLERTPKDPPFAPYEKMTAVGTLNKDGVSESHMVLTLRGDEEVYVRTVLRQAGPAKYDAFVQALLGNMGYGGTTSHASFTSLTDTATPLAISFDYHRDRAGDWDNYRIVPQVLPVGLGTVDEKEPPMQAIELGMLTTRTSTAEMKLPEGWSAELPEAVHEKTAFATYDETYRLDKGTVYTERKVSVLQERIPARDWKQYKTWGDKVSLSGDLYIQLTRVGARPEKKAPGKTSGAGKTVPPSNPPAAVSADAEKLTRDAYTALQYGETNKALSLLDQAKTANPAQKGLWSGYAAVAVLRNKPEEAIADMKHELELNPGTLPDYPMLASLQRQFGHTEDVLATLRAWTKIDPDNAKPVEQLVYTLNEEGRFAETVAVTEQALPTLPEESRKSPFLLTSYGIAQLKTGKQAAGVATLKGLIQDDSTPTALNSAAYALADANQELPLAETTERGMLKGLESETRNWTGNEAHGTLAGKSSLLFASWDTMGWILFREGKLTEADSYVDAAMLNQPNVEIAQHLGDIRAANGDPAGARRAYQLALATQSKSSSNASTAVKTAREALKTRLESTKKAGAHGDLVGDLADLRKVPLGPAGGRSGSAEYRVLLSAQGVESAEPTEEKTVSGGSELIKAMKMPQLFPAGSAARLVKLGILNCHAETCELIFEP